MLAGGPLADRLTATVERDVATLRNHDVVPTLGTVLMTDDPTQRRFMDLKHERCASLGIETVRVDVPADAPAERCYDAVESLRADDDVTALFVQVPLPDHVDEQRVRSLVPAGKDVDCFTPENLGRLVAGDPHVVPATAAAVVRLLAEYDVETAGRDVVVVGRDAVIARPLAALLSANGPDGDATVTLCHTATTDLTAHTRRADVLVTAAGHPGLVDGSMLGEGVVVVDVSATRVQSDDSDSSGDLVGDVDAASAREPASAITPVPGGVGPLTMASLVRNVVDVTGRAAGLEHVLGAE
nr:tetrahydrofolate dehydrogenase/cyclohydrolase catalytic domain-containing protein [Halomarina rubra]